ncbi:peptidyl-tRNA hydrolase ICT1, mitochondrial isoform X1 [Amblyraja radiata]|uniref:peptidyl-tRNA hydrolase ICT1, mitochondrial isoform X1 n=1 Tax=Amblyraja radiata TaxID=386614 RepID=UPI00140302BB|nr:peptidyl-tRNA hydrolase ICT1, mitochondrial isoform X1 [Amblyraja radiata]
MMQRGFRLLGAAVGDLRLVTALLRRQYRSVYSLDRLYPDSGGTTRSQDQDEPSSNPSNIDIPIDRLKVTYSRSSGPGGQNVNKVNTKAEVRFHVATADWLSKDVQNVITAKYQNRINRAGQLIVTSEVSRYQMRNLADCLQKIRDMVTAASETPKQPSKESAEIRRMRVETMHRERLRQKKIQSSIKQDRRVTID